MSHTIKFSHPFYDDEEVFDLTGVGEIQNNGTVKLDAEAERDFVVRNGMIVKDYFQDAAMVDVTGTTDLKKEDLDALLPPAPEPETEEAPTEVIPPGNGEGGGS